MIRQEQSEQQLAKLRQRIDALDEQIQELIRQRTQCVLEVAKVKQQSSGVIEYYRPEREAQLLRRVKARNRGPLSDIAVARLFREIISAGMVLEQTLTIAFAETDNISALQAVYRHFGQSVCTLAVADSRAVFQAARAGDANFGLVSADQTSAGLFLQYPLLICGEVVLAAEKPGPGKRFLVIGKQQVAPSGDDKTTLLITDDKQQQPYLLDLNGHRTEPATAAQIASRQSRAHSCACLGSYPSNVL